MQLMSSEWATGLTVPSGLLSTTIRGLNSTLVMTLICPCRLAESLVIPPLRRFLNLKVWMSGLLLSCPELMARLLLVTFPLDWNSSRWKRTPLCMATALMRPLPLATRNMLCTDGI